MARLTSYDPNRLSNLGLGHAAIDAGGAYTYLNTETGWEFSATAGLTYNFENPDTDYTSGIDWHLDVGMSRFLSEKLFVGLVGCAYVQLTPDKASGRRSRFCRSLSVFCRLLRVGTRLRRFAHPCNSEICLK